MRQVLTRQFPRALFWASLGGANAAWAADPNPDSLLDLSLEELLEVEIISAPRFSSNPANIPSAVTIISRQEIQLYGWQTLADILQAQPGFTVTNDYSYSYATVRGLAVSGDYRARTLLLLNGNRLNENIYDSINIDSAALLDLATIDHIELIQGPSASVYGGNSMLGVINVVTRSGQNVDGMLAKGNISSGNRQQVGLTWGKRRGDTDVLFNANAFDGNGRGLTFPELTAAGLPDHADSVDAEQGYKFMARMTHREWRFSLHASGREKTIPTGSYGTLVGDLAHKETDRSILSELGYRRSFSVSSNWDTRVYYGAYRYDGEFPYDYDPPYFINLDDADGKWWGVESTLALRVGDMHQITTGLEYRNNFQQRQINRDRGFGCVDTGSTEPCSVSNYDSHVASFYWQDEMELAPATRLILGYRVDNATGFEAEHSFRLGLVQQAGRFGSFKYLYAEAYRLPNPSERLYALPYSSSANSGLSAEDLDSQEVTWELPTSKNTRLTTSVYRYILDDFIGTDIDGMYINLPSFSANGFETDWTGTVGNNYNFGVSYTYQVPDSNFIVEELIPQDMLKVNLGIPLSPRGWTVGLESRFFRHRHTGFTEGKIAGYGVTNVTLTWLPPGERWQLQMGVKDLFDREYEDPVAEDGLMLVPRDRMRQFGRSWFIDFGWTF